MRRHAAALAVPLAFAAAPPTATTAAAQEVLETLVVSGGLTPIPVEEYGRAFSVVTAEDIERRQITSAVEAVRALPGVSVSRTGAAGGTAVVRIRGAESNHTLVLIDGIEANAPESGEFDFSGLLASEIARIEVLRGPQSSLYGSNALGGVIAITTKRAEERGVALSGSLEGGSDGTVNGSVAVRGLNDRVSLALSLSGRRDGGFDVSGDPGGEDDRDRNVTANAALEVFATETLTLGATVRLTDRTSDFDGFMFGAPDREGLVFDEDSERRLLETFGQVYADLDSFGGRVRSRARIAYTATDDESFTDGARTFSADGSRLTADLRTTLALDAATIDAARHTLTLGTEFQRESFENNDASLVFDPSQLEEQSRDLFGLVGEYRGTFFDALDVQLGIRHDVNDDFEDATTFSAGLSYRLPTDTRLHGSVGRAVQNPTFFEQFGFIPGQFNGNPDLEPETSLGWDVGVEQSFLDGRAVIDVTYFRQSLDNEIFTDFPPPDFTGTPFNEDGESDRQGVEIGASVSPLPGLSIQAAYTWTQADDFDGRIEIRRPRHEGRVDVSYAFLREDRASVTLSARGVSGNFDGDFTAASGGTARVRLDDYAVLDIAGSYRVRDGVEFFARIENLTDTDHEELHGYETQGITGFAGLRVSY